MGTRLVDKQLVFKLHVGAVICSTLNNRIVISLAVFFGINLYPYADTVYMRYVDGLVKAHYSGKALPQLSAIKSGATLANAYEVQGMFVSKVMKKRKGIAGFKGALVGLKGQKKFKVNKPLSAVIFQDGWLKAEDKPVVEMSQFPGIKVETEIGFIVGKTITKKIDGLFELKSHFESIVPVIELPAGELENRGPLLALDLAAANVLSSQYIVGRRNPIGSVDPDNVEIRLSRGSIVLNNSTGAAAYKGQWKNLLYQVNRALDKGYTIQSGQMIITGALGDIIPAEPGSWSAEYGALGDITFLIR